MSLDAEDVECPVCKGPMVLRKGAHGEFFGCRKYPRCEGTRNIEGGLGRIREGTEDSHLPSARMRHHDRYRHRW